MASSGSSRYLISNSAYKPFLQELGLEEEILDVRWKMVWQWRGLFFNNSFIK